MALSSSTALRRLCELQGWNLTNLQAQKLLYFAHMIALGESDGARPLVNELFQAWDYGPVLPSAYREVKIFGDKPIKPFLFSHRQPERTFDGVIKSTLDQLGGLSSSKLVAESHWVNGAWAEYYRAGSRGTDIPNDAVLAEYKKRIH
ncbi:Panacea domain-containing protein [Sphingomonas sp. MMS24-JH45]